MPNLFENIPRELPQELVEVLLNSQQFRVERIVSRGHASAPDFWYDQQWHEWVLLVSGAARLAFDDSDRPISMQPGDWVHIEAHRRHRVEWTASEEPTIWLAVHYAPGATG